MAKCYYSSRVSYWCYLLIAVTTLPAFGAAFSTASYSTLIGIAHPTYVTKKNKACQWKRIGYRRAPNFSCLFSTTNKQPDASITDNASKQPTSNELSKTQLRELRREIISRRRRRQNELEDERRDRQDLTFLILALVPSLLAYNLWSDLSISLAQWVDVHGVVGTAPDGNKFANDLLRPTITGVVVPVISIALATLVSTTVNVLRERQVTIRALINKEACDLRLLRRAILGMFGTRQHAGRRSRALTLLRGYVDQINKECLPGAIEQLMVLELSGGVSSNQLDELSAMLHGVEGAAVSRQESVGSADVLISRLNENRSDREALLMTDFPDLHWIVLVALSVSVCFAFLLESNQLLNQFLNSIQLRVLFALLVGVFSATATLCIDLRDPFNGTFSIASTSAQVGDLRLTLLEDVREANVEAEELSSSSFQFFGIAEPPSPTVEIGTNRDPKKSETTTKKLSPSRFGNSLPYTIYFHLLTGPLGSNVRALGDAFAWVTTFVSRRARSMLAWKRWPWVKPKKRLS